MLFSEILKDNKDFLRCYKKGRFCACPFLTAYYIPNASAVNRVGISVSKKIGNAVKRNRAKRIIRAAYRLEEKNFPIGYDIVFVARQKIDGKKTDDISQFFSARLYKDIEKNYNLKDKKGKNTGKK